MIRDVSYGPVIPSVPPRMVSHTPLGHPHTRSSCKMSVKFAIVVILALGASQCEAFFGLNSTDVEETGSYASKNDILEDMLDFVIHDNDVFQGRKKKYKKKLVKYLAVALLLKVLLLPKLLAIVKFITAKAYLLSIIALIAAATAISCKKKEQNTEQVINLVPKRRTQEGQDRAYRYWRRRRSQSEVL